MSRHFIDEGRFLVAVRRYYRPSEAAHYFMDEVVGEENCQGDFEQDLYAILSRFVDVPGAEAAVKGLLAEYNGGKYD